MEVANVVASIISAFGNGMDLFRRMAGKKSKVKGRNPTWAEEEAWLRDSLQHRPLDIQRAYRHHSSKHGHRYEIGDSIAHTSLAHTLLMLNSGLMQLINQALSKDSKRDDLSRRSLLSLSEVAAADTLNALRQLSLRLSSQSQLTLQAPPRPPKEKEHVKRKEEPRTDSKLRGGNGAASPKKRPGPTPLLVRGGWVRPKTVSVVSVASSKSSSSKEGKSTHHRSKSEPVVPKTTHKKHNSPHHTEHHREPVLQPIIDTKPPTHHQRSHSDHPLPRQPSMLIVPSDLFLPQSQPQHDYQAPPPRPPKVPLHSRPNPNLLPRPKSSGTMKSASTKIGEIPDRGHANMLQPVQEQSYDPRLVEYIMSTPDGAPPEQPKKRGRGFRFWKKENQQPIAAY